MNRPRKPRYSGRQLPSRRNPLSELEKEKWSKQLQDGVDEFRRLCEAHYQRTHQSPFKK